MNPESLSPPLRTTLLGLARATIDHGIRERGLPQVTIADYPPALRDVRSTFVTLEIDDELRGCIGSLEAREPLVADVVHHAYAAAFDDPRFPPVRLDELPRLRISISVLHPAEALHVHTQDELLHMLRPDIDGLILDYPNHRATFLPTVWKALPDPLRFVRNLKRKAGLTESFWSPELKFSRYTTESFGEP